MKLDLLFEFGIVIYRFFHFLEDVFLLCPLFHIPKCLKESIQQGFIQIRT